MYNKLIEEYPDIYITLSKKEKNNIIRKYNKNKNDDEDDNEEFNIKEINIKKLLKKAQLNLT